MKPYQKFLIEFGPVLVFFIGNWKAGPFWGTGLFMVSIVIALLASWFINRKLSRVLLVTTVLVMFFGGLTLWLHEAFYIQIKVTVVNIFFAAVLLGGLYFNKLFLKNLLGLAVQMPDKIWRILTWRWSFFFLGVALLNEVLRQVLSFDQWTYFKLVGLMVLTIAFALANAPLMAKHMINDGDNQKPAP